MEMQEETISPILEAVIQTCRVAAEQKNITITMQCLPEQLTATINRSMLEQAIINLLTNAVTYSPEGSTIHLRAEQQNKATTNQSIRIDVQDQGPGISHEHQKRIFERFYRCDKARSREHGGTGLGLAIVKHIAACHNGEVELQSRMGSGSTFSLIFPKQN